VYNGISGGGVGVLVAAAAVAAAAVMVVLHMLVGRYCSHHESLSTSVRDLPPDSSRKACTLSSKPTYF
jgi:hypothetical protein